MTIVSRLSSAQTNTLQGPLEQTNASQTIFAPINNAFSRPSFAVQTGHFLV